MKLVKCLPIIILCFAVNAMSVTLPQRSHPFLLVDEADINDARRKTQSYLWANNSYNNILNRANNALQYSTISDTAGDTSHKTYWANIAILAQAYALTGYEVYAEGARGLLLQYADVYPEWNYVFGSLLTECQYICKGVWAYDLIYNSPSLTSADKQHIEQDLFYNMAMRIKANPKENNHQTWHNAAMLGIGLTIENPQLVELSLYGDRGFKWQLKNWILSDGWWAETTPAYHLFALDAVRYTVRASWKAGIDFTSNKAYKAMYDTVVDYVQPDFSLPSVNDTTSTASFLDDRRHFYEWAYAQFGDPDYLHILNRGSRDSVDALFFGVDNLPSAPELNLQSKLYKGAGCAVLRNNQDSGQLYAHLDYGLPGGWHGHRDKLALILYGLDSVLLPDPSLPHGELSYTSNDWKYWYKQTFAHNTVCVDQQSQVEALGSLRFYDFKPGFSVVQAECNNRAYKGVMMRRTLALSDRYLVDIFELASDDEHCYDWVCHGYGSVSTNLSTVPRSKPIGYSDGYQYMENIHEVQANDEFKTYFQNDTSNVLVATSETQTSRLFLGDCVVGNHIYPTMVIRKKGKQATFVSIIEAYTNQPLVVGVDKIAVSSSCGNAVAFRINNADGREDLLMLADNGGIKRTFGIASTSDRFCYVQTKDDQILKTYSLR